MQSPYLGVDRRLRMNPLLSYHMRACVTERFTIRTYEWSVCYDQHIYEAMNIIESNFDHWFALPDCRSTNWFNRHRPRQVNSIDVSSNRGFRCVGSVPPTRSILVNDKPPGGYRLLLNKSTDSPDSNSKTLNNLNKRNRSHTQVS